jgi:hypothetical protein
MTHTHTHTHTSGPWTCAEQNDWDGAHIIDKYGRIVADCQGCDIPGAHGEVGTDEAKANAYLLAAAPDLLAACKAALALMQDPDSDEYFDAFKLESILESAISKAEGKI